ncbi:MAG: hypothetical protein HYT76_05780 [Deltaproteobacteria bacterium]|nr:hypothetical protein [Deltaproteobacteria bacterium]
MFLACGGDEAEDDLTPTDPGTAGGGSTLSATLSSIQTNIFTPTCATSGCHSDGSASAGLILTDGNSFSNLVNVTSTEDSSQLRVKPGEPDNSYLVKKIEGNAGTRMPRGSSPLSSSETQAIRDWISNGAENN